MSGRPIEADAALAAGVRAVDDGLRAMVGRGEYAGVAALVARGDRVVATICHGERTPATAAAPARPMTPDTVVRLASLTKPVTAVALMLLVEDGVVDLDAPVARWLPELGALRVLSSEAGAASGAGDALATEPLRAAPTVRQTIANLAGFGYGLFDDSPVESAMRRAKLFSRDGGVGRLRAPLAELPARVADVPLAAQPGERWRYGVSHDLVGVLVERAASMPFGAFLTERIFAPLGMRDTGFHVPADAVDRFAAMHGPPAAADQPLALLDDPAASPFLDASAPASGGGGLVSTLDDYARFAMALACGGALGGARVLREETLAAMLGNHLLGDRFPVRFGARAPQHGMGYGLGVGVYAARAEGSPPPGTFGWIGTSGTTVWIEPRDGTVVLALPQRAWHWAAGNLMVERVLA